MMSNVILSTNRRVSEGRVHFFQESFSDRKGSFLYYHWLEAKNRVFYLILSFAITLCICYIYSRELVFLYVKPFISLERSFIFTELTEALYVTLEICVITSLCLVFPLLCYQTWCFSVPSLYNRERKRWSLFLSISTLFSILALLSVYFLVLPEIASILLMFEIKSQILTIQLEARIDSYVNWSSKIFLAMLLYGQLPLLSYIAYHLGFLSPGLLIRNRKLLFALSLLVAALLSPPDVIAQWLVTISIWSWIEVVIFLGMVYNKRKEFVGLGIS
ncbi:Twin-arginine translocase subunit TatC-like protein (mitochondrion) [Coccomyxa sp. Obi]|nr:Twin-arginine translocase subunit TatC-like protein [Coccomyxa sp. Obi]